MEFAIKILALLASDLIKELVLRKADGTESVIDFQNTTEEQRTQVVNELLASKYGPDFDYSFKTPSG